MPDTNKIPDSVICTPEGHHQTLECHRAPHLMRTVPTSVVRDAFDGGPGEAGNRSPCLGLVNDIEKSLSGQRDAMHPVKMGAGIANADFDLTIRATSELQHTCVVPQALQIQWIK